MTWKLDAEEYAKKHFPKEACGLVIIRKGREVFWPCKNISEYGNNFCIDPADYAAAEDEGEVTAIWHSHCGIPPEPSEADKVGCEKSGLEWFIYATPMDKWNSFKPSGFIAPLVGRQFVHGVVDCYSLVRDWYQLEKGIILPDFDRKDDWWHKGENLYIENFKKAGFEETDKLEPGCGIIMQIMSPVPNHAAVYLGSDLIIHHMFNRLSSRDVYGGMYKKCTSRIVRYAKGN